MPDVPDAETHAWLEAELTPPLEPYGWGDVDPETLGGRLVYVQGYGWIVDDADLLRVVHLVNSATHSTVRVRCCVTSATAHTPFIGGEKKPLHNVH